MTFHRRWQWMSRKDDFIHIADVTMRIQTRRISCDVANILLYVSKLLYLSFPHQLYLR